MILGLFNQHTSLPFSRTMGKRSEWDEVPGSIFFSLLRRIFPKISLRLVPFIAVIFFSGGAIFAQDKGNFLLAPQLIPIEEVTHDDGGSSPLLPVLSSNCPNSDFSSGTWDNWTGCYGYFSNTCQFPGLSTTGNHPVHKLIPAPGYLDHNTCDSLNTVFPGENFCARLGDTSYTTQSQNIPKAGELKYEINVTNESSLLICRYAVVLQSGSHTPDLETSFQVKITDLNGVVLDPVCGYSFFCAQYSGPPVAGWHLCPNVIPPSPGTNVYWKDWSTMGMDLSPYMGQTVRIVFKARPCAYNTHFGYAYVSAHCGKLAPQTCLCEGQDSATLTAPPGFVSYNWSNGATSQVVKVAAVEGATYQCTLTSYTGCTIVISTTLHHTQIQAGFTQDLKCAQVPSLFTDTTTINQNEVVSRRWFFGDPASGQADSSHLQSPTHSFTAPGNYNVTLVSYSTEGCCDTATKQITVFAKPYITNSYLNKTICSHSKTNIVLTSNTSGTLFTWTYTTTSPLISGAKNQVVPCSGYLNDTLVNSGSEPGTVIYHVVPHKGSCSGDTVNFSVIVYPHPNLNPPYVKSICDSTFTNIALLSNLIPDITLFTWTCTVNPGSNITGYSNNTTTPSRLINQLLRNPGPYADTVFYHILPRANGCLGDNTVYRVGVNPLPPQPIITGPGNICAGESGVIYSTASGMMNYLWTVSPGGTITAGGWTNSIAVTWNQSGTQTVQVNYENPAGCAATTPRILDVSVELSTLPGVVTGGSTIGLGAFTDTLKLNNYRGSILGWQKRHNSGAFADIPNTAEHPVYIEMPDSTGTWDYRAEVRYKFCPAKFSEFAQVSVQPVIRTVNLTVFLEGLYNPTTHQMNKAQDVTGDKYPGTIADKIKVQVAKPMSPYSICCMVEDIDLNQDGTCTFEVPRTGSYYLVIRHRNSLETWSAIPVNATPDTLYFDFSTSAQQAYGNNLKEDQGRWLIWGGDVNQDGIVDSWDMNSVDNANTAVVLGYVDEDANGDGIVDSGDMNLVDNNSTAVVYVIVP
jgi:hypothetical protein